MSSILFSNIKILAGISEAKSALRGAQLSMLDTIEDAYLVVEGQDIAAFGKMKDLHNAKLPGDIIDATGKMMLPAWCDSHTHLVYSGSREEEFVDKIKGRSYAEIAAGGGGILNSARKLSLQSEDQLFAEAYARICEAASFGTASIEIKSGYGLTVDDELKMLRVIKKLRERSRLNVRATFLGAHTYPQEYIGDHAGYINLIIEKMLPVIAREKLADYADVFCEKGFFSNAETEEICQAAMRYGIKTKIHANQLSASGAVQTGIKMNAVSVDHLEVMDDSAIDALAGSPTIGTLLPSAAFFLRMPYPPARKMIGRDCAVALASDCNPGSSPGLDMNFIVSLACIGMMMLPEEAINAATFNGACAMELQELTGSIAIGKQADLILTKPVPSLSYIPYSFSSNCIEKVFIKGESIH